MKLYARTIACNQPFTFLSKHSTLGASQGYEYASDKAKQNPGALSLNCQKIRIDQALFTCSISSQKLQQTS